jgi:eukaryotic-like serine/threonine-protein kinase
MELVEGCSLAEKIRNQSISFIEALDLGIQIASGLAAAHKCGIVHRRLKPSNVIVTEDGTVKLIDFGLAKLLEATPNPSGFPFSRLAFQVC